MADYIKVTAKNVTEGPKIFNSAPHVILHPGQSTDGEVDISEAELASMTGTGWFEIRGPVEQATSGAPSGTPLAAPVSLSNKTKAELLDIAKAEGVEVGEDDTVADIKAAIELHREEAAKA